MISSISILIHFILSILNMNYFILRTKYRLTLTFLFFPVENEDGEEGEEGDMSRKVLKEASPPSENPDQEAIVESLKSICNILLHNEKGLVSLPCFFIHAQFLRLQHFTGLLLTDKTHGWMAGDSSRSAVNKGCCREAEAVS